MHQGADELAEDLALIGLADEALSVAQRKPNCYELWPENKVAFSVFTALDTNWRVIVGLDFVNRQGLDYTAAKATLEMMCIKRRDWPAIFDDLRCMERAAKEVFNKKDA